MLDSSLDLPLIDRDSSLRQLRDFDLMPVISSLLSSRSSKRESDDPQRAVAEAKPRIRRAPVNPILKGPNPYGRAGKLRCELCRHKRQGVNSRQPLVVTVSACTMTWTCLALIARSATFRVGLKRWVRRERGTPQMVTFPRMRRPLFRSPRLPHLRRTNDGMFLNGIKCRSFCLSPV
jgi:hypothetical protein